MCIRDSLGLVKSSSDLIAFCDDDDLWLSNKLVTQLNFLQKNNFSLVSTNAYTYDKNISNSMKLFLKKNIKIEPLINLVYRNQIITSSVMFRKSHFFITKYDNLFDSEIYVGEDWIAWLKLRCSTEIPFGYLPEPLIHYRLSNNSLSKKYNFRTLILMSYKVIKLLFSYHLYFTCLSAIFFFILRLGRYIFFKK